MCCLSAPEVLCGSRLNQNGTGRCEGVGCLRGEVKKRAFFFNLNTLIDKWGFSPSARMKDKEALLSMAGKVAEQWYQEKLQVTEYCLCVSVLWQCGCMRHRELICWEWNLEQMDRAGWVHVDPESPGSECSF